MALVVIALASLAATEWGWRHASTANFFLTPFRIWELLAGAFCAMYLRHRDLEGQSVFGFLGIAMIVLAVFIFDATTPFPSLYALLPVVGSCLCVLFAKGTTAAARFLSLPVFVGIGLVSYSAYLWHQPLFAFVRLASPFAPSPLVMLVLSILSVMLAYVTWRFVEQPFRKRDVPFLSSRRAIFGGAAVAAVALVFLGGIGHVQNGFPDRFDPRVGDVLAVRDEWLGQRARCHFDGAPKAHPIEDCTILAEGRDLSDIKVAMIGDSHSLAMSEVVQAEMQRQGISSYAVSYTGCIGLPGFYRVDEDAQHDCPGHNREFLDFIKQSGVETVVLTSRFPLYVTGERFNNGDGGIEPGDPAWIDLVSYRDERAGFENEARRVRVLAAIKDEIMGLLDHVKVVLVYPVPEAGWNVVRYAVRDTMLNEASALEISTSLPAYEARNGAVVDMFNELEHPNLFKVDPAETFCDTLVAERCVNAFGDDVFYRDEDHLSYSGAALLAPEIIRQVLRAADSGS